MNEKSEMCKTNQNIVNKKQDDGSPYFVYKFSLNEGTGRQKCESIVLSNGEALDEETTKKVLKKTTGTDDISSGFRILERIARGMPHDDVEGRLNQMAATLPLMSPQNETEAMLLGQFIALQESGLRCLRLANSQEGFYHVERFFQLGTKLFNVANQTMQTLLKYRSGGRQEIQIVHVHNEGGQAIVAQNVTHGRGDGNKS